MKKLQRIEFLKPLLAIIVMAGTLVGCDVQTYDEAAAGFGGTNPPVPPPPPPPPPGTGFNPVFSAVQANVFNPSCLGSNCHSGGSPQAGLNLEATNSYAMLYQIPSSQNAGVQRVNPGFPDQSYLIQKLENIGGVGLMPPGAAISQPFIDSVRQWITDGALDDTVVVTNPIRVTSIFPAPGAMLGVAPAQILAGFDADLDVSTVNMLTFMLDASVDGIFDNGNDMQIAAVGTGITVGGNPRSAMFDLTGAALADDTYRIRLLGNGANVIMDTNANVLDGEPIAPLPSGDGTAGGDFSSTFTLATAVAPTFDEIQTTVFDVSCANCHSGPAGGSLPSGLDLSNADASYLALFDIDSTQNPLIKLVEPGSADNSYLIMKLEGNGVSVMPPSGALNQALIDGVRLWIDGGAPR